MKRLLSLSIVARITAKNSPDNRYENRTTAPLNTINAWCIQLEKRVVRRAVVLNLVLSLFILTGYDTVSRTEHSE
jgi:hypothetical protein